MTTDTTKTFALPLASLAILIVLVSVACGNVPTTDRSETQTKTGIGSDNTTVVPSGREPDASVSGTVRYNERLPLSEGASLVVDLRDVSFADGPAPLIARKIITNPGQVPIDFDLGYNRQDINSRNTYAISAKIVESDGRLAFTNDTAYDLITGNRKRNIDMLLKLAEPPPDQVHEGVEDWRSWNEVPARITSAHLLPDEARPTLRVTYLQSAVEGCALRGSERMEQDDHDFAVTITLMEHPEAPWSPDCDAGLFELDSIHPIDADLSVGETYRVFVNGELITTFVHRRP